MPGVLTPGHGASLITKPRKGDSAMNSSCQSTVVIPSGLAEEKISVEPRVVTLGRAISSLRDYPDRTDDKSTKLHHNPEFLFLLKAQGVCIDKLPFPATL